MTDADADGTPHPNPVAHVFYRYMRPLIDEGHIYIAQPPLYKVTQGKKSGIAMMTKN